MVWTVRERGVFSPSFSIAKALKGNGCRVIYFAGYKKGLDVFKRDEIEAATDQVIWAVDAGPRIAPRRPQDLSFVGNIVQAMVWYATSVIPSRGDGEESPAQARRGSPADARDDRRVNLREVSRIIAIGSDGMMRAVKEAEARLHKEFLRNTVEVVSCVSANAGEAVHDLRETMQQLLPVADEPLARVA